MVAGGPSSWSSIAPIDHGPPRTGGRGLRGPRDSGHTGGRRHSCNRMVAFRVGPSYHATRRLPMSKSGETSTDRIEKKILLRATRARVWRALTDPAQFGAWFGAKMPPGSFAPGKTARPAITHPSYEHLTRELTT